MDAFTEAGLVALIADHPTPWRATEVTRADYYNYDDVDRTDDPDAYREIAWTGIVDATGRPIGAFGFRPHWPDPVGPRDEYVALAALVNGVAGAFLRTRSDTSGPPPASTSTLTSVRLTTDAEGRVIITTPTGAPSEVEREVPAELVAALDGAWELLHSAHEAVLAAAGFDPADALDQVLDAQQALLRRHAPEWFRDDPLDGPDSGPDPTEEPR